MKCIKCSMENNDISKFCGNCGNNIDKQKVEYMQSKRNYYILFGISLAVLLYSIYNSINYGYLRMIEGGFSIFCKNYSVGIYGFISSLTKLRPFIINSVSLIIMVISLVKIHSINNFFSKKFDKNILIMVLAFFIPFLIISKITISKFRINQDNRLLPIRESITTYVKEKYPKKSFSVNKLIEEGQIEGCSGVFFCCYPIENTLYVAYEMKDLENHKLFIVKYEKDEESNVEIYDNYEGEFTNIDFDEE